MVWQSLYERLASVSLEMRRLDDQQFMELQAVLPNRRRIELGQFKRDRAAFEREDKAHVWMKSLLKFNELARQNDPAPTPPPPAVHPIKPEVPRNREEAEYLGFVMFRDVVCAMEKRFTDYNDLSRYLERHENVRIFKSGGRRRMVHAADLIRQLASDADGDSVEPDPETIQDRADKLRKKRQDG